MKHTFIRDQWCHLQLMRFHLMPRFSWTHLSLGYLKLNSTIVFLQISSLKPLIRNDSKPFMKQSAYKKKNCDKVNPQHLNRHHCWLSARKCEKLWQSLSIIKDFLIVPNNVSINFFPQFNCVTGTQKECCLMSKKFKQASYLLIKGECPA